jgi:hypothetical protein
MAVQKQDGLHTDVGESAVDLTGKEDLFCVRDSSGKINVAGAGAVIAGVISEGKPAGYHTSYNTRGNPILRVQAGAAIAINTEVQSNGSGQAVAGSTNPFGRTRKAVGGSGEIAEIETYSTNLTA